MFSNTQASGGLFGTAPQPQQPQQTASSLFGNATQPASTGLFGSSAAGNNSTGFGGQTAAQPSTGSLFGNLNSQPNNQNNNTNNTNNTTVPANNSLFNAPTTSIFGTQAQPAPRINMFGSTTAQNQNQNQNQNPIQNQNQSQQQQMSSSIFNPQTVNVGTHGHTMTHAQLQRLQFSGASTVPNEKKIADQIMTIRAKWDPNSSPDQPASTILKSYLYNAIPKEYAPFYYPDAARGEDERSWEEALSQKPALPTTIVNGVETTSNLAYVPVLVRGFKALGERVETQANIIKEMRGRLHEMNNSLSAVMDAHQQRITVRIETAKKQHQVLSQRCLKLAVKVQVLRNRGYALDAAEEGLRKTLMGLEKQVFDPGFVGREDEIWARMVALRERMRWLEEEGKRVQGQVEQAQSNPRGGVSEDILARARKILKDYDEQLQHLNKELGDVRQEFIEWEASQRRH